jgi:hypothetical protein
VSSDDQESNDDEAEDEDYEDEDDAKMPPPPRVSGEVFGQIYNGRVIRDDIDDMVEAYQMLPDLTEEEHVVDVLISEEEERGRSGSS